ncbi:MAG: ChaN family lipoprotein [Nitrospirae bacterium]|nr:ChaN family lipoprotein [Nitrospirota bacterium]
MKLLQKTVFIIIVFIFSPSVILAFPVTTYNLDVSIDVSASELTGISRIDVVAGKELLLVINGTLEINYIKLNNKQIGLDEGSRTLRIVSDKDGILEISYKVYFRDDHGSYEKNAGAVKNVIDAKGISLTNTWYPEIKGQAYYNLKVTLPKGYEAVAEADEVKKVLKNDSVEFYFDFPYPSDGINLTASDKYRVRKDNYNNVQIYAYFFSEDINLASTYIEFTKKYLKLYESLLGKYPYKRFSIVENFLPTGYSFPTFTLLGNTIVQLPFIVETSLGHEILHQWFGNYVYVDYQRGNWAEGLTTYLADHLYEEQKNKGWEYRKQILTDYKSYVTSQNEFPLKDFKGRVDLSTRVIGYGKTAMVFHMLKMMAGEQAFFDALKDIVKENPFRMVSWDNLKESFEKSYGQDLSWFFEQWVDGTGLPDISIDGLKVEQNGIDYKLNFTVSQKGKVYRLTLPMTIYIRNDAVTKSLAVDKGKNSFEFSFPERPDRIVFDEDYDVARELDPQEFAPVIARLLGDKCLLIAMPRENAEIYSSIIEEFESNKPVKMDEGDIKNSDIMSSSVIIFGFDNPLTGRIFGKVPSEDAGFSMIVKENPLNPQKVIGIINGKSKKEVDAAYGKIAHYGKYSKLLFENGKNTYKEITQTDRGIIMNMQEDAPAVDLSTTRTLSEVTTSVVDRKIIYVGEAHDVFAHHAVQLDIIRGIYKKIRKVAIGMEMFQRPFQETLDSFISGKMDETDFLKMSEYFKRWGFDYHLYKPILDYARSEKIPVVALNLKREIIEKVSREGLDSLSIEEKNEIPPDMDLSDNNYRERLKKIFDQHKNSEGKNFDFFYQAQLLWDETMSQSIDEFLNKNPDYQIVVLAGQGHLEYGSGIPKRTFRRDGSNYAIVLIDAEVEKGIADYIIFPKPVEGVTSPKLMIFLTEENGELKIKGFPENSVSEKAGIKEGDIILSLDNMPVKTINDIKIHLLYKKTGETVKVEILRKDKDEEKKMVLDVAL